MIGRWQDVLRPCPSTKVDAEELRKKVKEEEEKQGMLTNVVGCKETYNVKEFVSVGGCLYTASSGFIDRSVAQYVCARNNSSNDMSERASVHPLRSDRVTFAVQARSRRSDEVEVDLCAS